MDPWLLVVALVGGGATVLAYLALRPLDARCPECGSRDIEEVEVVQDVGLPATMRTVRRLLAIRSPS